MINPNERLSEERIDLMGEALLLEFLGKVLLTYPDPNTENKEWYKFILEEDLFSEIPFAADQEYVRHGKEILQNWTENCRNVPLDNCILDLRLDNTHLFGCVDEILAPPWESVYFNKKRLVNQIQVLQVRQSYRKYGLRVEKENQEPDDHIGFELLFLSFLAAQALKEEQEGNYEKYEKLIKAHRTFYLDHLGKWGPLWCDQVVRYAQTDFYRGIAFLLKGIFAELDLIFDSH